MLNKLYMLILGIKKTLLQKKMLQRGKIEVRKMFNCPAPLSLTVSAVPGPSLGSFCRMFFLFCLLVLVLSVVLF
jgi:hypothetical protein